MSRFKTCAQVTLPRGTVQITDDKVIVFNPLDSPETVIATAAELAAGMATANLPQEAEDDAQLPGLAEGAGARQVSWSDWAIAACLNGKREVHWDRFVEFDHNPGAIDVYGWVDRPDGRADFVLYHFPPAGDDVASWTTSSVEISRKYGEADHADCQRVADRFAEVVNVVVAAPAPRREGEPARASIVRCDECEASMPHGEYVGAECRNCANGEYVEGEPTSAQAVSLDLVAAAREVVELEGRDIGQITGWVKPLTGDTRRYIKVGCDPLLRLRTALQNTPQPDESEAVKLLRELVNALNDCDIAGAVAGRERGNKELNTRLSEARIMVGRCRTAAETFLSNTPEVDNAE